MDISIWRYPPIDLLAYYRFPLLNEAQSGEKALAPGPQKIVALLAEIGFGSDSMSAERAAHTGNIPISGKGKGIAQKRKIINIVRIRSDQFKTPKGILGALW